MRPASHPSSTARYFALALAIAAEGCAHSAARETPETLAYQQALDAHVHAQLLEARGAQPAIDVSRHRAVWVKAQFDDAGAVTSTEIARSSGLAELDALARKTLDEAPPAGPAPAALGERFDRTFRFRFQPGPETAPRPEVAPAHRENPTYPRSAAMNGLEGCVTVSFMVGPDGVPTDPVVFDSNPLGLFEAPTLKALEKWRYAAPAEPSEQLVTLTYELGDIPGTPSCDRPSAKE